MQMKIENIRLFLEVVRCGSINKAAENNYIAQQNLSVIIKNMENELGDKLLKRNNTGIYLTENGQKFYECAQSIISAYDGYLDYARKNENNVINIFTTLALSECLADLQGSMIGEKYYISIHERGTKEIRQMIAQEDEGIYFLAVIGDDASKMAKNRNCGLLAQENKTSFFCHKSSKLVGKNLDHKQISEYMSVNLLSYDITKIKNMINVNSISACKKTMKEKGFYCSLPCKLKHILGFDDSDEWVELMENYETIVGYFLLCYSDSSQKYQNAQRYIARSIQEKFNS